MGGARHRRAGDRHADRLPERIANRPSSGAAWASSCSRWWRCCSVRRSTTRGAGSGSAGSACSRPSSPSSRPSSLLPRCSSGACTASTRSNTRSLRSGCSSLTLFTLIILEPDFGTSMSLVLIATAMVFAAGPQLPLHPRRGAVRAAARGVSRDEQRVPAPARADVSRSVARPARRRLSGHPVDHRGRHGRRLGQGPDERRPEAVFPARAAHRFHLLGDFRGARADWRDRRAAVFRADHVAGPPRHPARSGHLRRVAGARS